MSYSNPRRDLISFNLGERPSFEKIFDANWIPVFNLLLRWLRNKEIASEVCEDCFVKLWEKRGEFLSESKVRSFLYIVAKNASIDELRKRKPVILDDFRMLESISTNDQFNLEINDLRTIVALRLDQLISGLSPRAREIVKLCYFEDLKIREIASLLGIKERTVANIKERAIKKLRLQLTIKPSLAYILRVWFLELGAKL
jgi:RNA polymerase sigma-70 factor (ECF subfamily)